MNKQLYILAATRRKNRKLTKATLSHTSRTKPLRGFKIVSTGVESLPYVLRRTDCPTAGPPLKFKQYSASLKSDKARPLVTCETK